MYVCIYYIYSLLLECSRGKDKALLIVDRLIKLRQPPPRVIA